MKGLILFLHAALACAALATTAARATQTVSLNGQWQIAFDDQNAGKREQWHFDANLSKQHLQPVTVPASWETIRANAEGVAWYRKQFDAPASWKGKSIRLQFGAVNYLAEVWLNGELVGYHEGGYDPFEFDIDDIVQYGKTNTLILRVISPIVVNDSLYIDGMEKWEAPHWRGALIAGPWQDVSLKVTERVHMQDLFVETALDGSVKLNLNVTNGEVKRHEATIKYTIRERNTTAANAASVWESSEKRLLEPGANDFTIPASIPNPKLWSPDAPNLYEAVVTIDGKDEYTTRFGVREFTISKDGFLLNGKKFYMKAGFWEGLYPVGLAVPDSPEMLRKEITLAKEANFNTLRPWRKPPAPWVLDMADEMGILMIGAPALECMNEKPAIAGQLNRRVFHEIESMVRRDRNHPSIVIWELFNEVKRAAIARLKRESSLRARAIDPTRLIIDESGGWAGGCHAYMPRSREPVSFNEIHSYQKAPASPSTYNIYLNLVDGSQRLQQQSILTQGAVSILSEVGYGSIPDLESIMKSFREKGNPLVPPYTSHEKLYDSMKTVMQEAGLDEIFGDITKMALASQKVQADGNKLMIEATRLNPRMDGYCIHAFTDGDWVIGAGVLDIWRNPKPEYFEMLKVANAPLYVSARVEPANIYAGSQVNIKSSVVSEQDATLDGNLVVTLSSAKGEKLWAKTVPVTAKWGITAGVDEKVTIPAGVSGECVLDVKYLSRGETTAANSFTCDVFAPLGKNDIKPPKTLVVLDGGSANAKGKGKGKGKSADAGGGAGKLKSWLGKMGVACSETIPAGASNDNLVIITTIENPAQSQIALWREIFERVRQGAILVMLNPPLKQGNFRLANPPKAGAATTDNRFYTSGVFPLDLVERPARGSWVPNNHAVSRHPYFDGLPSGCFMGQLYANVVPMRTIMGLARKPVLSSVCWKIDRSYLGIQEAWWGSDLARVPCGKGSIVLSTLAIVPNLDADPVADILMRNLINNTK